MIEPISTITLSDAERMELSRRAYSRAGRADDARRAQLILLLASGDTWARIRSKLDSNDAFIDRWSKRFGEEQLAGLFSRHAGQEASTLTLRLEARILDWTVKYRPTDGSTHWSTRKLGEHLGVSHTMVARVWRKHALQPHRLEGYMASDDPHFETKAADIIGLYQNPPKHAAVFCADKKTAIQALDRLDPVLPLSPGRAHGFEYMRHGTLSLNTTFNTKTAKVLGKTAARHTAAEFVAFLTDLIVNQPRGKKIHVIADNNSARKNDLVEEILAAHLKVHLHFTPTYSSWFNRVELWFAKIERDVIACGVFTSISDLKRDLMRYICQYNKAPRTVKWKNFGPSRRIAPFTSAVTVH
jgi:transposase